MIDFTLVTEVLDMAQNKGVSFSMNYQEYNNMWYFEVSSAATSECWIGKDHSFDIAIECVIEHLVTL